MLSISFASGLRLGFKAWGIEKMEATVAWVEAASNASKAASLYPLSNPSGQLSARWSSRRGFTTETPPAPRDRLPPGFRVVLKRSGQLLVSAPPHPPHVLSRATPSPTP